MKLARFSNDVFPSFPSLMNRFFEGDLTDWSNFNFAGTDSTLPAVNIKENENDFQIEVAAPGMRKKDFKVNYNNGRLTISSELKDEKSEKNGEKYNRMEYRYQSFQRSFAIPENMVDGDKIQARYTDGILSITLPKKEQARPKPAKQIKIS